MLDKEEIPKGPHCHTKELKNGLDVYCPYLKIKNINDVNVPWCSYLNQGGVPNSLTEEESKKLKEHFGNCDEMEKQLPLNMLWDAIKECGENNDSDG